MLRLCTPNCLTFLNSWGKDFADRGYFRVEDKDVLNETQFFDIYWTENDLTDGEKEAYEREGAKKCQELSQAFPSILDLNYACPKCNKESKVGEFSGNILEAECPKCHGRFKPTNKGVLESLYNRAITCN